MSNTPAELKYTESHEWVRTEADGTLTIGITDLAQEQLGDIVFLELPEAGRKVNKGEAIAVVESVKAASDIYAPVTGEIIGNNADAAGSPESVNEDAYDAWLFKIKPANVDDVSALLSADQYKAAAGA
ncbi:glycine cleavage system protein GcvH [Ralstonia solanacearum]|uniref:Glycine cleavage system H protein n=1 Tax=Ralstonia solanacearum K60 TaxID=1091042 RepID=A0AAP7ZN35_RALSL|nr:glycine cleavage system protein GcvH [Ralstonia solanacearum]MBT1536367.1 glycine cleavage system protein GcvH [Ralstonia solanacearum]OYQ13453.1 glycine cleavage system protein H [Ralstonia solanacearum K60]QOK80853.1 glycine cleavage system protein GcvH [Ralstonia solanacearum]CCF97740.1 glycine cleavage complex protein H, carrier of aminomethyl moiety via covalently bound lipoyl cofactor [Ralstonia solanacearum K60]